MATLAPGTRALHSADRHNPDRQHFQSIWWADDGNCVVIAKKLFRTEVLGRRGHRKIFETESMGSFILQLYLHGFCTMERDSIISISIEELQAVAAAGPALGKLLFYYNPLFNRDDPSLLTMFTQCAGGRKRAPAARPLGPDMEEDRPRRRRRPEAQPPVGAAQEDNDTQPSATTSQRGAEKPGAAHLPHGDGEGSDGQPHPLSGEIRDSGGHHPPDCPLPWDPLGDVTSLSWSPRVAVNPPVSPSMSHHVRSLHQLIPIITTRVRSHQLFQCPNVGPSPCPPIGR
ncbi:uncharacterized protein LOC141954499 [Strix uralensis]|uniref:uncharacterized protein LOC141954499 n=1 Tax=Strix uralensis TaxID=36305 RepID=UPI003DA6E953